MDNTEKQVMVNTMQNDAEETIDLLEVLQAMKKKFWLLILAALVGGCIAWAYTAFLVTPMYTSTASVLVLPKEQEYSSVSDLQYGTSLTSDYKVLINSSAVISKVEDNLEITPDIKYSVSVENQTNTRILLISVKCNDAVEAKHIVDEIARVSSEYIAEKMEVTAPKVIEEGKVPLSQSSPNMLRNLEIGALIGLLIAVLIVVLQVVLNDTIKSGDDMEKYLGIYLLASVPDRKDYINTKKSGKKGKKRS
ncbi:MAG: polysaccharide export protein [Blautia sp.]|nr:polysaccharide export protein [Blautia sp.]